MTPREALTELGRLAERYARASRDRCTQLGMRGLASQCEADLARVDDLRQILGTAILPPDLSDEEETVEAVVYYARHEDGCACRVAKATARGPLPIPCNCGMREAIAALRELVQPVTGCVADLPDAELQALESDLAELERTDAAEAERFERVKAMLTNDTDTVMAARLSPAEPSDDDVECVARYLFASHNPPHSTRQNWNGFSPFYTDQWRRVARAAIAAGLDPRKIP